MVLKRLVKNPSVATDDLMKRWPEFRLCEVAVMVLITSSDSSDTFPATCRSEYASGCFNNDVLSVNRKMQAARIPSVCPQSRSGKLIKLLGVKKNGQKYIKIYYLEEFQAVQLTGVVVIMAFKAEELRGTVGSSGTLWDSLRCLVHQLWECTCRVTRESTACTCWGSSNKACNPGGSVQSICNFLADFWVREWGFSPCTGQGYCWCKHLEERVDNLRSEALQSHPLLLWQWAAWTCSVSRDVTCSSRRIRFSVCHAGRTVVLGCLGCLWGAFPVMYYLCQNLCSIYLNSQELMGSGGSSRDWFSTTKLWSIRPWTFGFT